MKQFLKTVLAVIVGLILMSFIGIFLISGFVAALSSGMESSGAPIAKEGILKLDMSKIIIAEQGSEDFDFQSMRSGLSEETPKTIGLWQAVQAVNAAAEDPGVKCIYILPDGGATDIAQLSEFRTALVNFRNSGKPILAYTISPGTGSYYLASVADKIYMTSYQGGMPMMLGLSSRLIFLKDLLDLVGVNMQLVRHGKYKSAGEMYVRNSASPENLEQNQSMINSLWGSIAGEIAQSRDIRVEDLNKVIDDLSLCIPEDFVACGLVDELVDLEGLKEKLAVQAGKEKFKDVKMIPFCDYAAAKVLPNYKAKDKIAIIFADGEIIDGKGSKEIAGDRFAKLISEVREDKNVKAVVLRVNSPGGSVLASEKIKRELDLIKGTKPLVASYGSYAASGGYWISNNCDRIFSDKTTLTGSIGVFSIVPEASKAVKNLAHVTVTAVNSNKHSDMYSFTKPLDKDEYDYLLRSVEVIYDKFTATVAEGRGLKQEYVDEIGQGRVWTGLQGLENGLVDEIGTLEDAVRYAAGLAGDSDLKAWNITETPKPLGAFESIMSTIGEKPADNDAVSAFVSFCKNNCKATTNMARIPYEIELVF